MKTIFYILCPICTWKKSFSSLLSSCILLILFVLRMSNNTIHTWKGVAVVVIATLEYFHGKIFLISRSRPFEFCGCRRETKVIVSQGRAQQSFKMASTLTIYNKYWHQQTFRWIKSLKCFVSFSCFQSNLESSDGAMKTSGLRQHPHANSTVVTTGKALS